MTVNELAVRLKLNCILVCDGEKKVTGGYTGDLLSWVMGRAEAGDAWVTIMSNMNVAAVAQLTDVACVVFAEGVLPDEDTLIKARQHGINLLGGVADSFTLCAAIARELE